MEPIGYSTGTVLSSQSLTLELAEDFDPIPQTIENWIK